MRAFDHTWFRVNVAQWLCKQSSKGVWKGKGRDAYFKACEAYYVPDSACVILTRDEGYHSGGWWKNPDYERCYHLSISFQEYLSGNPIPRDKKLTETWIDLIFGEWKKFIWAEGPFTSEGKRREVWHYRVFCDVKGLPIIPKGEVYSRQFTERGWKSFSELFGEEIQENE